MGVSRLKKGLLVGVLTTLSAMTLFSSGTAMAQHDDDSFFRVTPYLWMLGIDGQTAVLGQNADVEAEFSDLLDALNFALMVSMEWNRGNGFVYLDPMFSALEINFETPGPLPLGGTVESDMIIADLGAGYEINDTFDIYAGVRYFDNDITVTPNTIPTPASIGDDWTDFLLGFRVHTELGEKWSVAGKADVAVAGDSDSAYYLQFIFMRHFGENKHLDIGWRHYDVDFESGSGASRFLWDIEHTGPIVGFSWEF